MRGYPIAVGVLGVLGNLLLLLFLGGAAGAVLCGQGFEFTPCWVSFLPVLLCLPPGALAQRRWADTQPRVLAGAGMLALSAAACLALMGALGVLTVLGVVLACLVSLCAGFYCALVPPEQDFVRLLLETALAVLLLILRRQAGMGEQALLAVLTGLIPVIGFMAMHLASLVTEEFAVTQEIRRGGRRLLALFLAGVLVLSGLFAGGWMLLFPPGNGFGEESMSELPPEEELLPENKLDEQNARRSRSILLAVVALGGAECLFLLARRLVRAWLRRGGKQLPWKRPAVSAAGETPRPPGFVPWLRRAFRRTLRRLRSREKLGVTASPEEQVRFVYRCFLRERLPEQPELLCRTPEEALGAEEGSFAALYNAARYGGGPLDESAREEARNACMTLGKIRKK